MSTYCKTGKNDYGAQYRHLNYTVFVSFDIQGIKIFNPNTSIIALKIVFDIVCSLYENIMFLMRIFQELKKSKEF